jgi:hypothetical protein
MHASVLQILFLLLVQLANFSYYLGYNLALPREDDVRNLIHSLNCSYAAGPGDHHLLHINEELSTSLF